jgi:ATPase subunit of ABC transporter with duplicated ATPase domains
MTHAPRLLINRLSYVIPNTSVQFDDVTLSFTNHRFGIIGDNGSGKTTLIKLISGFIKPDQGTIVCNGTIAYCPQYLESIPHETSTLGLLGIQEKWNALHRVQVGELCEHDFELIDNDWGLESEVTTLFQRLDLSPLLLESPFTTLSGGQKTKVLLAKTMLSKADFILLDEPTNNLDSASRKILLEWIKNSAQGFIIVSHDRELLGSMDEIIELTAKGIHRYGGNYAMYDQQKSLIQTGLQHKVEQAKRQVKQCESSIQTTKERHAERQKKGRDDRKSGRQGDKLLAGSMKNNSENTQSRNRSMAEIRMQQINEKLQAAKSQIEIKEAIKHGYKITKVYSALKFEKKIRD